MKDWTGLSKERDNCVKLVQLLREDAANANGIQFDLASLVRRNGSEIKIDCGTQACAIGLACISNQFDDLSYTMIEFGYSRFEIEPMLNGKPTEWWDVAMTVFGLNWDETQKLFTTHYYEYEQRKSAVGELAVADRLQGLIDGTIEFDDITITYIS